MSKRKTREEWLRAAVVELDKEFFKPERLKFPKKFGISCGFVKGSAKALGGCHPEDHAKDKTIHMFICPTQDEGLRVLDITLHEMIHAYLPDGTKHGAPFRELATKFGLEGKPTATYVSEGTETHKRLKRVLRRLGKYPHVAMEKKKRRATSETKWKRFMSLHIEDYKVVAHIERVAEYGAPLDPMGHEMVPTEGA